MSKSDRTQQRHAKAFWGQRQLTGFIFKAPSYPARVLGPKMKAITNLSPPAGVSIMQDIEPEPEAQLIAQSHSSSSISVDTLNQISGPARMR